MTDELHGGDFPILGKSAKAGVTFKDPICDMDVEPATAAGSFEYKGVTYYFCCEACLEKFRAEPEDYIGAAKAAPKPAEPVPGADYTCPMDPEVHQSKPGACPKCGMALEPTTITMPQTKTQYVCPMHPEVVQDEPGSCPKCGMALEPRTVTLEEEAESRIHGHEAPLRHQPFSDRPHHRAGALGNVCRTHALKRRPQLDRTRAGHAGGALLRPGRFSSAAGRPS